MYHHHHCLLNKRETGLTKRFIEKKDQKTYTDKKDFIMANRKKYK